MAFDNAQLDADLERMIADLPLSVTCNGETVSCTRTSLGLRTVLETEGLRDQYRFSVYTKQADWTTAPETDDIVTISGTDYRVLQHQDGNAGRGRRLDLGEKYAKFSGVR